MRLRIWFHQQKRLAPQILNATFLIIIVVFVLSGSSLAQRRKPAAPVKPASTQTYTCVPFQGVRDKDRAALLRSYPFLKDDLYSLSDVINPKDQDDSGPSLIYVADIRDEGMPSMFFITDGTGSQCPKGHFCPSWVFLDLGQGYVNVLEDTFTKGEGQLFISKDHSSLLSSDGYAWKFKNTKFQALPGKMRLPKNLPQCKDGPIWNPAKAVTANSGETANTRNSSTKTPDALVAELYEPNTQDVFQAESRVPLDKYFDKEFADLIWMEIQKWETSGTSDLEPFDYVLYNFGYGNGDVDNSKPIIGKPVLSDGKAQVNVTYNIYVTYPVRKYSSREAIQFFLSEGKTGWRITDIKYDGKFVWCVKGKKLSLFDMYSMDAKATAADREYWDTKTSMYETAPAYKDYLRLYPNGAYAEAARAKLQEIEAAKNTKPVPKNQ